MSRSQTAGDTGIPVEFTLSVKVTHGDDGTTRYEVSTEPPYPLIEERVRAMLPDDIQFKDGYGYAGEITLTRNKDGFEERIAGVTFGQRFKITLVVHVDDGYSAFGNLANSMETLGNTPAFRAEVERVTQAILNSPALLAQLPEMETRSELPCQGCGEYHDEMPPELEIRGIVGTASFTRMLGGGIGQLFKQMFGGKRQDETPQGIVFRVDSRIAKHVFFEACGGMSRVKEMAVKAVRTQLAETIIAQDRQLMANHAEIEHVREQAIALHTETLRRLAQVSTAQGAAATKLMDTATMLVTSGLDIPTLKCIGLTEDNHDDTANSDTDDGTVGDGLPDTAAGLPVTAAATATSGAVGTDKHDGGFQSEPESGDGLGNLPVPPA